MYVLSLSSLKGGVGKTTVTLGLASSALARSIRTLVVDCDPQADVSTGLGVVARGSSITDVLTSPKKVSQAITASSWSAPGLGRPRLDVLVGSPSAINHDSPQTTFQQIWVLEEALSFIESEYDLVLIDCAPSLNALTRTAWAASDRVGVVTEPGLFSASAADRALRAINEIRHGVSPRLQPLGIIVNRVHSQSIEHQYRLKELQSMFGAILLNPHLPERTTLQQAQGANQPLHLWPGEVAQDLALRFDQLLDKALRASPKSAQSEPTRSGRRG